jgi:hypothetical protein
VKAIEAKIEDTDRADDREFSIDSALPRRPDSHRWKQVLSGLRETAGDALQILSNPWFWLAPLFAIDLYCMLYFIPLAGMIGGPLAATGAFAALNSPVLIKFCMGVWRVYHIPRTEGVEVSDENRERAFDEIWASRKHKN